MKLSYGGRTAITNLVICEECEGATLAWFVCIELGIIPTSYPKASPIVYHMKTGVSDILGEIPAEPDEREVSRIEQLLLNHFNDVFSSETRLKPMIGGKMKIELMGNAQPHAIFGARPVPIPRRREANKLIEEMRKQGIIEPVMSPTDWCHPMVLVPKPGGGLRLCVDFTKLNKFVKRPGYPLVTPKDVVSQIPNETKYMSTFDATHGYWQLPLDEQSQPLTTFMTPWGRFKFLRAPMGLVSTGDEFCRRGDAALAGLPNVKKVVDDILVHSGDFKSHVEQVWAFLCRCREHNITLNRKKVKFSKDQVKFVGYVITRDGIAVDPEKIRAIKEFPPPTNLTQLQSFMGMVNQLGDFSADISTTADPLRCLLKKNNEFNWTAAQEEAFKKLKTALTKTPVLATFDPTLPTALQTDASRRNGLGYALLQWHDDKWRLIQCGSRFVSDAESRYAMVELELLAVVWATQKCKMFLSGMKQFTIVVDHQPLVSILNKKSLDMIENPRILRLKEKMGPYMFTTVWRKGKNHAIPDALSRAPITDPTWEDKMAEQEDTTFVSCAIKVKQLTQGDEENGGETFEDPILRDIKRRAKQDEDYQTLIKTVLSGFPNKCDHASTAILPFWKIRNELSIDDGLVLYNARIVLTTSCRKEALERLHDAHQGIVRLKRRARQVLYWPRMNIDIENHVQSCARCQERQPSLTKEPMATSPRPSRVFQEVSADLFTYQGKSFLVYTDRLSGWPVITEWNRDPSSRQVIRSIRKIFSDTGVPIKLRSDGGSQFTSHDFKALLKRWGVNHVMSTPHYPQSNGLAEAAVKAMKHLLAKTSPSADIDHDDFQRGLLEWRNTPRADGRSPAQMLFGQSMRTCVPAHHKSFSPIWHELAEECDRKAADIRKYSEKYYNAHANPLKPMKIGTKVRIQNTTNKLWTHVGVIVGVGRNRDYLVKLESGRIWWRNRRFLRVDHSSSEFQLKSVDKKPEQSTPRRSKRVHRQPKRFVDDG